MKAKTVVMVMMIVTVTVMVLIITVAWEAMCIFLVIWMWPKHRTEDNGGGYEEK